MIVVSVMYPTTEGKTLDLDYYMATHIPLVQARWGAFGLSNVEVLKGQKNATGAEPDYVLIANLTFDSLADFDKAGRAHGKEIMGDVANFTSIRPVMQVSDKLAS